MKIQHINKFFKRIILSIVVDKILIKVIGNILILIKVAFLDKKYNMF